MVPPSVEVVHIGSACRDVVPEDPRGWRLGGGVTYASLTTARLGLRTAAIVGVDAAAATASELEMLRDSGVDLQLVPVPEGPIYHNLETPTGRIQTSVRTGVPLPVPDIPSAWRAAPGWSVVPVAGEVGDDWAAVIPDRAHLAVAWQGFLRDLVAGKRVTRRPPRPSAILRRADLVGVSHHDVAPETPVTALREIAPSGGLPARHARKRWRPAHPPRRRRPGRDAALPPDGDDTGGGPDRRRRHVPGRPAGLGPAAGRGRPPSVPASARLALRGGRRIARRRGPWPGRRTGPIRGARSAGSRADPACRPSDRGHPGGRGRRPLKAVARGRAGGSRGRPERQAFGAGPVELRTSRRTGSMTTGGRPASAAARSLVLAESSAGDPRGRRRSVSRSTAQ